VVATREISLTEQQRRVGRPSVGAPTSQQPLFGVQAWQRPVNNKERSMKKRFLCLTVLALMAALPMAAFAEGLGPPGGTIYAHDVAYRTIGTPSSLPANAPEDSFDILHLFPDCEECAAVSDAAPGDTDYNGGRWIVVNAKGIHTQLSTAEDVVAQATDLVPTTTSLVCPMIRK
jgi:hypothetical protein